MQTTNIAITILSVLDISILILAPLLDKRLYGNYPKLPTRREFFYNIRYEGRIYRLAYSSGGALLIGVVFLGMILLSKRYGHDNW